MVARTLGSWVLLVSLPMAWVPAGSAQAQKAEARALFEEGVELAESDRWAEALVAFRRSSRLVPRPSTSYNIANALYRVDRPVDALAELDAHDRMPAVIGNESAQRRSRELRSLILAAVAEVDLMVTPAAASVFVDGMPTSLDGRRRVLLLNPGTHFIQVARDGYHPERREVRVERGDRETLTVRLEPIEAFGIAGPSGSTGDNTALSPAVAASDSDDRKPFVKRPGFWVLIGVVGAAAIGAGVAIAVTRRSDAPACGTTGDCASTQGLSLAF